MRSALRIRPFIDKVDIPLLVTVMWKKEMGGQKEALELIDNTVEFINSEDNILDWELKHDLRFGQWLFNSGLEEYDVIYSKEEYEILMICGYGEHESFGTVVGETYKFIDEMDDEELRQAHDTSASYTKTVISKELIRRHHEPKKNW